jgi:RNA polymerase sigma-70 factor (ECF subfamily)
VARHTAFEILYKDYYARVFGLCRRLLNSNELAEDASQETFMRAYKNFNKFDSDQPFWKWIATIANNHCLDLLRQKSRSGQIFGDEGQEMANLVSSDQPLVAQAMAREDEASMNTAIATLPDKYRIPLILAYFNQDTYEEIADQLSISKSHVGILLLRAKKQIREILEQVPSEPNQ